MFYLCKCVNLEVDHLPLIYQELLEIKNICKSNQIENNKNSEEIKKIGEKLAFTIEDDPFADGSLDVFDTQFPIKKSKKKLKEFQHQLQDEPLIEQKLVNCNFAE